MTTTTGWDHEVVVIGAGFSGIGAGIKLREAGFDDFLILEQASDLGGTWRDNTYPGIAVDISSFTYSYSFEQNPSWSRVFAPGHEIKAYADHCADKYGIREHIQFETRVLRARFDEADELWRLETSRGPLTTRYLVSACGGLTQPKRPDIPGIERFEGKMMHSARWDHAHDLTAERVAVIGTGATAVQLVPAIAPEVERLEVFQRTPIWILPKPDRPIPSWLSTLFRRVPAAQTSARFVTNALTEIVMVLGVVYNRQTPGLVRRIERLCREHLKAQVRDPEVRDKLSPRYGFGCKRPSFSNDYYPTFNEDHVDLVTSPIARITERGIVTEDGEHHAVDTIVLATGFKVLEIGNTPPFEVYGRGGRELGRFWHEQRYQAYEGATVPGYPNFFLVLGPYSTTGASWFRMVEAQTTHLVRCLKEARRRRARCIEVRRQAHDDFFAEVQRRQRNTVFFNNGCGSANSYYFDHHGDAPFIRPSSGLEFWWRSRHFPLSDYHFA